MQIEVSEVEAYTQPKLFNICLGFDRSNDYGINQCDACDAFETLVHKSSSNGLIQPPPPVGLTKCAKYPAAMSFSASTNCCAATDDEITSPLPKFSVGGTFGTLRECDSESAVDFIASKAMGEELESSLSVRLK